MNQEKTEERPKTRKQLIKEWYKKHEIEVSYWIDITFVVAVVFTGFFGRWQIAMLLLGVAFFISVRLYELMLKRLDIRLDNITKILDFLAQVKIAEGKHGGWLRDTREEPAEERKENEKI